MLGGILRLSVLKQWKRGSWKRGSGTGLRWPLAVYPLHVVVGLHLAQHSRINESTTTQELCADVEDGVLRRFQDGKVIAL